VWIVREAVHPVVEVDGEEEVMESLGDLALKIVEVVLKDLSDRAGLDHMLDSIREDTPTQLEMESTLQKKVTRVLAEHLEAEYQEAEDDPSDKEP